MEVKGDSERMLYHLVYCLPLYGGMDVGDLRELEELQKKAAQAVTLSLPGSERNPMFNRLSWLAVNQLIRHTLPLYYCDLLTQSRYANIDQLVFTFG